MARRLPLRVVKMPNGAGEPLEFSYAEMMRTLLRNRASERGLSLDEVIRCVDAIKPIDEAVRQKADEVTLSDEQWRTLREKLDAFAFAVADQAIVDFGLMIRHAPEIGTEQVTVAA
jgi:hypothetical protein